MAIIRHVDANIATGDADGTTAENAYASLSDGNNAEEAINGDLVTDTETMTFLCTATAETIDDTYVVVDGWSTSEDYDLTFQAASGDEAPIDGWDATRYRLSHTAFTSMQVLMSISEDYVSVKNLQFEWTGDTVANTIRCIHILATAASNKLLFDSCRFRYTGTLTGYGHNIIELDGINDIADIHNCIFKYTSSGTASAVFADHAVTVDVYNCVFNGAPYCIHRDEGTVTARNCAYINTVTANTLGTVGTDYCIFTGGTGNNVAPLSADWDNEFVDEANGDYTPVAGGNIINAGVGTTDSAPALDFNDVSRDAGSCDIGVAEVSTTTSTSSTTTTSSSSSSSTASTVSTTTSSSSSSSSTASTVSTTTSSSSSSSSSSSTASTVSTTTSSSSSSSSTASTVSSSTSTSSSSSTISTTSTTSSSSSTVSTTSSSSSSSSSSSTVSTTTTTTDTTYTLPNPDTLYSNNSTPGAQTGVNNPTDLTDTTPAFSAIVYPNGHTIDEVKIQVSQNAAFPTETLEWDSPWMTIVPTIPDGVGDRISDQEYGQE